MNDLNTPTRPKRHDEAVLRETAKQLAPKVKEWCGGEEDVDLEDIAQDVFKAIRWNDDGYEVAKAMDAYMPDAALVEILDDTLSLKRNALAVLEKAWVVEYNLQPLPLETKVTWPKKPEAGVGIVTANDPEGKSTVMFEALGHVRKGMGAHGYIVAWEELILVQPTT